MLVSMECQHFVSVQYYVEQQYCSWWLVLFVPSSVMLHLNDLVGL